MKRETFKDLEISTKEIVNEINGSHVIRATFVKIQTEIYKSETSKRPKVSLKLPGKTRFGSIIFCAESVLFNKKALKTLDITENVILKDNVRRNILDENFWCSLLSLHEIIAPVVKWITILEGDNCTLSLVSEAFFHIEACFEQRLPESPTIFLLKRRMQSATV